MLKIHAAIFNVISYKRRTTMGVSVSRMTNAITRSSTNEVVQRSENICIATCNNQIDNINVIVDERAKAGDINISQKCESNALCVMKTSLDSIALTQLEADQNLDASNPGAPFMLSRSSTKNRVTESLRNTITQTISNVCDTSSSNIMNNLTFYIGNDATTGDINLTQEGVVTSACEIDSLASSDTENISKVVQKQHQAARIIITITFFVVVLIGMAIFFYYRSVDKKNETALALAAIEKLDNNLSAEQTAALLELSGVGGMDTQYVTVPSAPTSIDALMSKVV